MAETATAPSMMDSLRDAYTEVEQKQPQETPSEPVDSSGGQDHASQGRDVQREESAADTAQRARDEAGRFAKGEEKPRETIKLKEKPNAAQPTGAAADNKGSSNVGISPQAGAKAGDKTGSDPQMQPVAPPAHWKGGAKVDWNKLPAAVRESIDADHAALAPIRELSPVIDHFKGALAQRFGGNIQQGLGTVLNAWQSATSSQEGAVAFVRDFCHQYRIDPQSLVAGAQPVQGQAQEQLNDPYAQRFQQIETALQQIAQQPVLQAQQQIQTDIQSFQTAQKPDGSVAHPYFNDVKTHMGALMSAPGGPKTLDEAYEAACWANSGIRTAMIKDQQASQESERRQAIARAQGAAVSVSGAPGTNGVQRTPMKSVSDELRAVYQAAEGGRA